MRLGRKSLASAKRWALVLALYLLGGAPVAVLASALPVGGSLGTNVITGSQPLTMLENAGGTAIEVADSSANAVLDGLLNRSVILGSTDAAVAAVADTVAVPGPAGAIAIEIAEAVGADAIAAAAVACIASIVCGAAVAGTAIGIAALLDRAHVKNGAGGPSVDMGVDPTIGPVWGGAGTQTFGSAGAACESYQDARHTSIVAVATDSPHVFNCENASGGQPDGIQYAVTNNFQNGPSCQPVGGVTPSPFVVNGASVCPSGGSNVSTTPDDVKKAISQAASNDKPSGVTAVGQILANGGSIAVTPTSITGPASQPGATTTTTTTNPDGSSSTSTVSKNYDYTYRPDATGIDIDTKTTTHTTDVAPDGTVVNDTTGTTTTGGSHTGTGTGGTGTGGSSDVPDLCALHPDILACDKLGDPPTDLPQWDTKTVTFAPEDLGLPSGCPAPRSFTVRGIQFVVNYQPACDVAPVVAPGLVAFVALGCSLWILSVLKA